jgi:hypothetical protein
MLPLPGRKRLFRVRSHISKLERKLLRVRRVQHNHIKRHLPPVLLMRLGRLNRSKMLPLLGRKRPFKVRSRTK